MRSVVGLDGAPRRLESSATGREVATPASLFDRLTALAVWHDQARAALAEIARWYDP